VTEILNEASPKKKIKWYRAIFKVKWSKVPDQKG